MKRKRTGLLSVIVHTFNEASNLPECLDAVRHCADEIIVVDMYSTDDTRKIARRAGARVFLHKNMGFADPARNFAIRKATSDWVLFVDADERLREGDRGSIRRLCEAPMGVDAFRIYTKTEILGRWMAGTGWGIEHERHVRLFRRDKVTWSDVVHSSPTVAGVVSDIPRPYDIILDHHNYRNAAAFLERLNRYTSKEADAMAATGTWSLEAMLQSTRREFDDRFQPEIDGLHSLVMSFSMAFYRFAAHMKQWEKEGYPDVPVADIERLAKAYLQFGPGDPSRDRRYAYAPPELGDAPNYLGFYEDEGGWRWMGRFGAIQIPASLLTTSVIVSFQMRSGPAELYARMPVNVVVEGVAGDLHEFEIERTGEPVHVQVPLARSRNPQVVRVKSDGWFTQTAAGSADLRELSITVSNLEVIPV